MIGALCTHVVQVFSALLSLKFYSPVESGAPTVVLNIQLCSCFNKKLHAELIIFTHTLDQYCAALLISYINIMLASLLQRIDSILITSKYGIY
jgi:hypothetical protein